MTKKFRIEAFTRPSDPDPVKDYSPNPDDRQSLLEQTAGRKKTGTITAIQRPAVYPQP